MKKLVCHCGAVEAEINLDGEQNFKYFIELTLDY